jgi:hypothetical protein
VWDDNAVPLLEPLASTKHYLKRQMLFVAVRGQSDYSLASSDELGQGVLSLWEACRSGEPVDFEVPLRDKGKAAGTLCGRLLVKWEDRRAEQHARLLAVSLNLRQPQLEQLANSTAAAAATTTTTTTSSGPKALDSLLTSVAAASASAVEDLIATAGHIIGAITPTVIITDSSALEPVPEQQQESHHQQQQKEEEEHQQP